MFNKTTFLVSDYTRFKSTKNRDISPRILEEVRQMTKTHGRIIAPVIVTSDWYVIDGQHRLEIAKEMGLSVPVFVDEAVSHSKDALKVEEIVSDVNNYQSSWTLLDHVKHNAARGSKAHQMLLGIYESDELNPNRQHSISSFVRIATGSLANARGGREKQSTMDPKSMLWTFKSDMQFVTSCLAILEVLKRKGVGTKARYVSAVVSIMGKDKKFTAAELSKRLTKFPRERWEHTNSVRGAVIQLQDVMNFNRRKDRVEYAR
tara:strand:- start:3002 stop:3784 length:783 start_codon:yes stop_codon:yes gene_type:complete